MRQQGVPPVRLLRQLRLQVLVALPLSLALGLPLLLQRLQRQHLLPRLSRPSLGCLQRFLFAGACTSLLLHLSIPHSLAHSVKESSAELVQVT